MERGDDTAMLNKALSIASSADVIIAAVGECAEMSGESASRTDIRIPDAQRKLLEALFKTGKPVVVLLFTGRPLDLSAESENAEAILSVWFGAVRQVMPLQMFCSVRLILQAGLPFLS